jgi:hypothetical protein
METAIMSQLKETVTRSPNPPTPRHCEPAPDGMCTKKQSDYICHLSIQEDGNWTEEKALRLTKSQASGVIARLKKGVTKLIQRS